MSVDLDVPSGIKHRHSHGLVCTARNRWVTILFLCFSPFLFFMILFFHWAHQLQRKDTVYLIDLLTDTEMIGRELGRGGGGKAISFPFFPFDLF